MMEEEPPAASKRSEDLDASLNSSLNVSLNWSGYACALYDRLEIRIQTDPAVPNCPKLHVYKQTKCNRGSEISLCTNIICSLSVETSRKALQINCKDVYNHVYLSSKEQAENEGVNVILKIWLIIHVIPSVRRITEFKQLQASKMEREATFALFSKSIMVKSIVHFDDIGRSSIDVESGHLPSWSFQTQLNID